MRCRVCLDGWGCLALIANLYLYLVLIFCEIQTAWANYSGIKKQLCAKIHECKYSNNGFLILGSSFSWSCLYVSFNDMHIFSIHEVTMISQRSEIGVLQQSKHICSCRNTGGRPVHYWGNRLLLGKQKIQSYHLYNTIQLDGTQPWLEMPRPCHLPSLPDFIYPNQGHGHSRASPVYAGHIVGNTP